MASSYSAPLAYAAAAPQLGIPSILDSDPLLQFKGARSIIKSLPAATGSAIGPNGQVQFLIPQSMNGFIKPGSMYLKAKITVTVDYVAAASTAWAFAGQAGFTYDAAGRTGPAPASSVIDRLTVTFPGGVQMSYPSYDRYHWGILLSHALSREYVNTDLKMLEHAYHSHPANATAVSKPGSRVAYVCLPLDLPVFNSPSAVPLLLLSGGITIDLVTNSLINAIISETNGDAASNYNLSELTLVYEEIQVSPEFKLALSEKVKVQPYSIGCADRTWLGICDGSSSTRVNVGVGLSSMKALVGINQPAVADVKTAKASQNNCLLRWNLYVNGQQMNSMQLDTDVQNYVEFTRAIQSFLDVNRVSSIQEIPTLSVDDARRLTYQLGQFAFGLSTAVYSDANFALSGIPVDQLSIEFERGAQDPTKWGFASAGPPTGGYTTHMWALHDSVLTILPDGTVSLRK